VSPTCGDLLTEAAAQLHGWGSTQDRVTPLTADIGPTDTQFTVDFAFGQAVGITPGVVEIDSEQLYVTSIDAATGTATVARGFGRGYGDTTAAAHSAGARVISRPKFPRVWLFRQINEIIGSLFPDLFAIGKYTGTVTYPGNTYNLGSTTGTPMSVVTAQWQDPLGQWRDCPSFSIDSFDGTFRLGSTPMVGRPLRVLYTTEPRPFAQETDLLSTTGLPDSCADLLTLGVVAKLVPGLDISRAQVTSVEQSDRSRVVPPSAGVNVAKYVMAEFQNRLQNEAASLRRQYRPRLVRTS
jgi:hypothetical protein